MALGSGVKRKLSILWLVLGCPIVLIGLLVLILGFFDAKFENALVIVLAVLWLFIIAIFLTPFYLSVLRPGPTQQGATPQSRSLPSKFSLIHFH